MGLALLAHARRGLRIASGKVLLDGFDVLSASGKQLRALRGAKVAYVPQDPASALNPSLRVGTQIKETLAAHGISAAEIGPRVEELSRQARLDPVLLERYPHQLSGGQQQRVAIAVAFSCRPALIVADEPTTGLDVSTQAQVLDTVRSMCATYKVACVYISHDLAVVGTLVNSVAVMYGGRIIEAGPISVVFSDPAHPYTIGLLQAVPRRPSVLRCCGE